MAARYVIIDSTTSGTVAVGAKTVSIQILGAGTVAFGAYTLAADSPSFTVEAPNNTLLPAITFDATGSRAFILATYMQ